MSDATPARRNREAEAALRSMLSRCAPRLGLTVTAVDALVERATLTQCAAGGTIGADGDLADAVAFVVSGVVKVMCQGQREAPVVMQFVPPGQFFRLAWPMDAPRRARFEAVAHVASVVASVDTAVMTDVVSRLPPAGALQLMAYSWRGLSRHLYDKCQLLTMPLRQRLLHELAALARDFGRPDAAGTVVELALTHADLATLVVGTRANVTRAVAALRDAGQIDVVEGRFVICGDAAGACRARQ